MVKMVIFMLSILSQLKKKKKDQVLAIKVLKVQRKTERERTDTKHNFSVGGYPW